MGNPVGLRYLVGRVADHGIVRGLSAAAISFQVTLAVIAFAASVAHNGPSVIIDGHSMEPTISRGMVVVEERLPAAGPKVGDVVTFRLDNRLVTHRVVDVSAQGTTTRGDNNHHDDSTVLDSSAIVGRARVVVPLVGIPRLWVADGRYGLFFGWLALMAACGWVATRPYGDAATVARGSDDDAAIPAFAPPLPSTRVLLPSER